MNFFAIYLSDKVSFNTTVRQILSRRRISLTWGEDRLNVVRDNLVCTHVRKSTSWAENITRPKHFRITSLRLRFD